MDNVELLESLHTKILYSKLAEKITEQELIAFQNYKEQVKETYNQALEDISKYILNSCNNVTCREDINANNDFDFYASEVLDMLKEMKK